MFPLYLPILILALLVLLEAWRFSKVDSWYRRLDRGAPWQRRSWGFA